MTCETATDATFKLIQTAAIFALLEWFYLVWSDNLNDTSYFIIGGNKSPFSDRYEAFFIDYSLTPLLIQQNYIDSGDDHDDEEERL